MLGYTKGEGLNVFFFELKELGDKFGRCVYYYMLNRLGASYMRQAAGHTTAITMAAG